MTMFFVADFRPDWGLTKTPVYQNPHYWDADLIAQDTPRVSPGWLASRGPSRAGPSRRPSRAGWQLADLGLFRASIENQTIYDLSAGAAALTGLESSVRVSLV